MFLGLYIGAEHLAVAFALARDVEPASAFGTVLEEELVETAVLEDELGIELASSLVGQADVGCFTGLVLGVRDSSYQLVETRAAVAGVDDYGTAYPEAQGFEDLLAEVLQVADCFQRRGVVDALFLGCG